MGTIPQDFDNLTNLQILLLEKNNLDGDANAICSAGNDKLIFFAADCKSGIQCSCCDVCCEGDDAACNAGEWDAGFDPIWEYGYRRNRYSYDMGPHTVNIPPPWEKLSLDGTIYFFSSFSPNFILFYIKQKQ